MYYIQRLGEREILEFRERQAGEKKFLSEEEEYERIEIKING